MEHNRVLEYILSGNKEIPEEGIVTWRYVCYERGRAMRRQGLPCPPKPGDDASGDEPDSLVWIGYRVELGAEHMKKCEVARKLGCPDPEFSE